MDNASTKEYAKLRAYLIQYSVPFILGIVVCMFLGSVIPTQIQLPSA